LKIYILEDEFDKLAVLVYDYRFNEYGSYRMLDKDKLNKFLFNQISVSLNNEGNWVLVAEYRKKIVGLLILNLLPWDTKHFGVKMAKIGYLMANGDYAQNICIKNKLLFNLFKLCKKEKIIHISYRIDISDISSIHAVEKNGFRLIDTLVTYAFNRHKHRIPDIKELFKIREFKKQDLLMLVKIAKKAFSKDRFHLDHHFSHKKANDLYGEWIRNCCKREYTNRVFVAEVKESVVGFLTFRLDRELQRFMNYKICGHGLSAVLPGIKGVYPCLVKTAIREIGLNYDCLEFDTQLNNYEVIKVWRRFGFDFIRAKYTFHKW
jgi:hypothetical protein